MSSAYIITFSSGGLILVRDIGVWIPVIILMVVAAVVGVLMQSFSAFRDPIYGIYSPAALFGMFLNVTNAAVILFYLI